MFTGLIEQTAPIAAVTDGPMFRRIVVNVKGSDFTLGESIAINGVCLTVAEMTASGLGFDVIKETLDKTNLGTLHTGDRVNVERTLRVGDRLDGHFVQGHVDGTGTLTRVVKTKDEVRLTIAAPDAVSPYLIPKGSICVDGVSLTLASVDGHAFDVALIPTTLQLTTLGDKAEGSRVNLEADILAKTIVATLKRQQDLQG